MLATPTVASLAVMLVLAANSLTPIQAPAPAAPPAACAPPVWEARAVAAFKRRLDAYVALRNDAAARLPRRTAEQSPAETESDRRALAERIRQLRARAKTGDILSAALSFEIIKSLRQEIDADTWKMIADDNPGELPSQVNEEYRAGVTLATMPPNILAALPQLPSDIEYRFVDRHLVLLDTRAMLILDRIPYAVRYADGDTGCRQPASVAAVQSEELVRVLDARL